MAKAKQPRKPRAAKKWNYADEYERGGTDTWAHKAGGGWCSRCHAPTLRRVNGALIHATCERGKYKP